VSEWTSYTVSSLDREGFRPGGARRAIVELLGSSGGCLTAEEIAQELHDRGQPVSMASVYRVLALLVKRGLLQAVFLGQERLRYDPVMPGEKHSHHLVCDSCGRARPFEDDSLASMIETVGERTRYRVESHDLTLRGICPECAGQTTVVGG
jgi:Fur family ferric uptake transcriptional regulator